MKTKPNWRYLSRIKTPFLLTMKIFIFFFSFVSFGLNPENIFSQNEKITFTKDAQISIEEVLDIVKKQTKYNFIYKSDIFANSPLVEIKKGKIAINDLFKSITTLVNYNFKLGKNGVILLNKAPTHITDLEIFQQSISGTVTDRNGVPLPGANITEKGKKMGLPQILMVTS